MSSLARLHFEFSTMDPGSQLNEVNEHNTLTPSEVPNLVTIKEEVLDEPLITKPSQYDDYEFEPFHEHIYRTLSANFDNLEHIDAVNEAFEKLGNCLIENNIFNKSGTSKISLKGPASSTIFLKYRDIDDAFMDLVISENNVKQNNFSTKKIDLRPFKDNFFSFKLGDSLPSDNDESHSKNADSDSDEFESQIEELHSEIEISDDEFDVEKLINGSYNNELDININPLSKVKSEPIESLPEIECKRELDLEPNFESSCGTSLRETVRDVRVVVQKLANGIDCITIEDSDEEISLPAYRPKQPSKTKQTARKKTGGVVVNQNQNSDVDAKKEQQVIQQLSSKDGDFVPSVFDKMTRAARRDLERVLKESTSKKAGTGEETTEESNISDSTDKHLDNNSSSEDEDKELDMQKTAEILTSTILDILTKTKSKKLEKLGKELTTDIANKIIKLGIDTSKEPTSTSKLSPSIDTAEKKVETKPEKKVPSKTEKKVENKPEKKVENKPEKKVENKPENTDEDNVEEPVTRRITRETARQIAQKSKNTRKKSPVETNVRKTLAEQFEEIERGVERDIINCELSTSVAEESENEPKRPETRRSKQKQNETPKAIEDKVYIPEVKRPSAPKRKSASKSKKKVSGKNVSKLKTRLSTDSIEPFDQLIDGQFLIDSELNEDSVLSISDSNLEKSKSTDDHSLAENIILKASADSTTNENGISHDEISVNDVSSTAGEHLSSSSVDGALDKELVIADMNSVCGSINSETDKVVEECQDNFLIEANVKQTSEDIKVSESITAKDTKKVVNSIENKENDQKGVPSIKKDKRNNVLDINTKEKTFSGLDHLNEQLGCTGSISTSLDSQGKLDTKTVDEKTSNLSADDCEANLSIDEPFKVLNDLITDIEKNVLRENTESSREITNSDIEKTVIPDKTEPPSKAITNSDIGENLVPEKSSPCKEITKKDVETPKKVEASPSKEVTVEALDSKTKLCPKDDKASSIEVLNASSQSLDTSFLNYTMDDSQRLMIDENTDDLTEKDMELDTSFESNDNEEQRKSDNVNDNSQSEKVNDKQEKQSEVAASLKPLTNEEKIAQLTRRDPRLVNDKKIVNVLMRDPRIRNKLPKVEEEKEKPPPEPIVLDSPLSPDPEPATRPPQPPRIIPEEKSKSPVPPECTKPEIPPEEHIVDTNRLKKKPKKKVDEELLYKTPLSDLHESNNDRPTYNRNKKRKIVPPPKKSREMDEENRLHIQKRHRNEEELDIEGFAHNQRPENSTSERYYNHEPYDERHFMHPNSEEGSRLPEEHYAGDFENRTYYQDSRDFLPVLRDNYEQEGYARRSRNEENYNSVQERNDYSDNNIYSRREFFRRNKYAHDHDHFSNSRLIESRQENPFFSTQNTYSTPTESLFNSRVNDASIVSAYPPVSLLPDPMYSHEEDLDQSYGNMESDSFSPPSSDLCPPPPAIRSPTPELLRRDNYCPSPPRIGRNVSPRNERDYEEYNRSFHRNYERDEKTYRGRNSSFHRDNGGSSSSRGYRGGSSSSSIRRGKGRDYRRNVESPPRKRFASDYERGHSEDRGGGRWRRSPSWSPERVSRRSRERSMTPSRDIHPWDSPRTPSPPRWHANYRERNPPYKNYQRYN